VSVGANQDRHGPLAAGHQKMCQFRLMRYLTWAFSIGLCIYVVLTGVAVVLN
jgi:hypothetical protein